MKRYTVLTYIFCGYEKVHEVVERDPDADCVLVTDDPSLESSTWRVIYDSTLDGLSPFDKCYQVRFHPFRYAITDIVVRIDGSIKVKKSLAPLIDEFERKKYDRCLMIHPARNRMEDEYKVWVRYRSYPVSQMERCLTMMRKLGYNFGYRGLYQGCFEIVRNNEVNRELNELTFALLRYLGKDGRIERLDQTITSFVANSLFDSRLKVLPVSESLVTKSEYLQWHIHNSTRVIHDAPKIQPFLFDEPCKVWL